MRDPDSDDDTTYEDDHPTLDESGDESAHDEEPETEPLPDGEGETAEIVDHPEGAQRIDWVRRGDLVLEYRFWINPRTLTGLAAPEIDELAQDITKRSLQAPGDDDVVNVMAGIRDPLDVVLISAPAGKTVRLVIDGQRRCLAVDRAKLGDDALVPVIYREPTPVQWTQELADKYLADVLGVVGLRRDLSGYELSEAALRLEGTKDPDTHEIRTNIQIAEIIRRSSSWVSKILTARRAASPALLTRWRSGAITEEQFRDLATSTKAPQQSKEADKIVAARESGDKSAARRVAKELKEQSRAAKAETAKAAAKPAKAARSNVQQAELPIAPPPPPTEAKPKAPKPLGYAVVEDLLGTTRRNPPTVDVVKGILLGIQVAAGILDMSKLPRAWHQYVDRLSAAAAAAKKKKKKKK